MQNNSINTGNICTDCKAFINRILDSMTYFIKLVICTTVILYLINFIIPYVALLLADIPYYTIYYIQIWRLITTPFMTTNLFSVIFSIFFWYDKASKLEKEIGTIKYMLVFFMNSICIQILFNILMLLLSFIIQSKTPLLMKLKGGVVRNEGLWPILLCDITLLCLSNPNENMQFRFFPCVIKAKYYPLFLFLIFTIISGFNIDFESMCGIGFGFLYFYFLNNLSSSNDNKTSFTPFKGKGVAVGGGNNTVSQNNEMDKNNSNNFKNVTVTSSDEINSSDSRMDLNNSNNKE